MAFAEDWLDSENYVSDGQLGVVEGEMPRVLLASSAEDAASKAAERITEMRRQGMPQGRMAVLYATSGQDMPRLIRKALSLQGHMWIWPVEDARAKRRYDITTDSVTVSTIHSMKGMDFAHVTLVLPRSLAGGREKSLLKRLEERRAAWEKRRKSPKPEADRFRPLIYVGMTNANRPDSPILEALGVTRQLERMQAKHQTCSIMRDRGIALYNLADSPISHAKAETAVYKLTAGSDFALMSINNDYGGDRSQVRPSPLAEYRPIVQVGPLCIYRHKSRREFYASSHVIGSPPAYGTDDMEIRRFVRDHADIWRAQLERRIYYETYTDEIVLTNLFV
jgi:hypothetical protein